MPAPVDIHVRKLIVKAYHENTLTVEEIAKLFGVSVRTVYRLTKQVEERSTLEPLDIPGRTPIIDEHYLNIIKSIVLEHPDRRLIDYCETFAEKTGILICTSTMFNSLNKLDIRLKKKAYMLQS